MTNVLDDLAAQHNCSWQATVFEGMEAEVEKQIVNDELGEKIEMLLSLGCMSEKEETPLL